MSRIAVLLDDMFEDAEYLKPVEAYRSVGHEVITVGKDKKIVKGKKGYEAMVNRSVEEVKVEDFDAFFIPGGYSPDRLRTDPEVVQFTRQFFDAGKPVFTICHGPQLLITADVLKGRTLTGYSSIIQDIRNAGATFVDEQVVIDGNLVSSRNPGDLPAFIDASLKKLEEVKR